MSRQLSEVLREAAGAALDALSHGGQERTRAVVALRRLWREANAIGFPVADDPTVATVGAYIGRLDMRPGVRQGANSDDLRDIATMLAFVAVCAKWAEAARALRVS